MTYYGVKKGRNPGVYQSWLECETEVHGFSGAEHKKFSTEQEALEFVAFKFKKKKSKKKRVVITKKSVKAFVDGSYNSQDNIVGYGVVLIEDDEPVIKNFGTYTHPDMQKTQQLYGELKAAMEAVELAYANGYNELTIVHDYNGIEYLATGYFEAGTPITQNYKKFMDFYMDKLEIQFEKVKSHSGDKYNDMADKLAKMAARVHPLSLV